MPIGPEPAVDRQNKTMIKGYSIPSGYRKAEMVAVVIFLFTASLLPAQSIWTNATAGAWGNANNWGPNGIPNSTNAVATLTNSVNAYTTNTLENGTGNFPYVFGTLNCNYGGSSAIGGVPGGASASAQLKAAVSSGTPVINVASGGYTFFYSVLFGTQGFNKTGPGTLTFRYNSNAQAYTGNVTISAGTLELQQDSCLGSPANTVTIANGATLSARASINNQTVTLPATRSIILNATSGAAQLGTAVAGFTNSVQGVISESASGSGLTIVGAGTVVLGGTNTYTGPTTISTNSTLGIGGGGQLGSGLYAAALIDYGVFSFYSSANQTLAGVISGSGFLTINGTGTLTLSSMNTFSGATTLNAGTLALSTSGSLAATASITIAPGATFDVSAPSLGTTYTLGSSTALTANGGLVPATIKGSSNGMVNFASRPFTLNYDGAHPALTIAQAGLRLDGQVVTVNSATPLASGTYNLIEVTSANLSYTGSYTLTGTATNGSAGGTIGFSLNAGRAYVQMTIVGSTNVPGANQNLIATAVTNNVLNLSWPADHLGWGLWSQTNLLSRGLGTNWYALPNSMASNNATIPINPANPSVFFRLTYGDFMNFYMPNMMSYWDGHYQLDNANIPINNTVTTINDSTYTWGITRGSNAFTLVVDNEGSGNSDNGTYSAANNKSRAELYIPLQFYTNGLANTAYVHINYIIPPLTDYGTNNNPYWIMQIYYVTGKPMCFVGMHPAYGGQGGTPYLGVYTNMQADGTSAGETESAFTLVNTPHTAIGDMRSSSGFTLSLNLNFATNATTSVTAQIIPAANPGNVYQATCASLMQSPSNPFTNGAEMFLKFGSYNGGGTHHHAKVSVNYFDIWTGTPIPTIPVKGAGNYYIPALQRQISAGNYNNLNIN